MKGKNPANTTIISDDLGNEINRVKQNKGKDILIFGSPGASHSLMKENLIDDYWLFVNPILLGRGIPLFQEINQRTRLRLLETKTFSSGVVCLNYTRELNAL